MHQPKQNSIAEQKILHFSLAAEKVIGEYLENFPCLESDQVSGMILKRVKDTKFKILKKTNSA